MKSKIISQEIDRSHILFYIKQMRTITATRLKTYVTSEFPLILLGTMNNFLMRELGCRKEGK